MGVLNSSPPEPGEGVPRGRPGAGGHVPKEDDVPPGWAVAGPRIVLETEIHGKMPSSAHTHLFDKTKGFPGSSAGKESV